MPKKRKKTVLTIEQKLEIIKRIESGTNGRTLAVEFCVGTSTISDIKKKKEEIRNFSTKIIKSIPLNAVKTQKKPANDLLEEALMIWFIQRRAEGMPISGPMLCEKALIFNKKLNGLDHFNASTGWLRNFKKRNGIRCLGVHGEVLSADASNIEKFISNFNAFIERENYSPEFIYNADETGLNWKTLPHKTFVLADEKKALGYKIIKERITIMACSNVTGDNKIKILVIGKSKKPRAIKNVKCLPVAYKSQNKAWMNTELFIEWYDEIFIPEVKDFQKRIGKDEKVLLLVDNAPSHPLESLLERENGKFRVVFLPPNVTSLLQPMDQGVIASFKKYYKKFILKELLLNEETEENTIPSFLKCFNIKKACDVIDMAWKSVKNTTIQKSWNKLIKQEYCVTNSSNGENISLGLEENIENICFDSGCFPINEYNIREWYDEVEEDPGFELLSDEQIVASLTENYNESVEDDSTEVITEKTKISNIDALKSLELVMEWYEEQCEFENINYLVLKNLRNLAAKKRVSTMKQLKITDFIKK